MISARTTTSLLIAGLTVTLFGMSAMADNATQTLGTLPAGTMSTQQPVMTPGATAGYKADPGSAATYTAAQAVPDMSVLQPKQAGDVSYVTGGIGDEEIAALQSVKSQYDLSITSASKSGGAFTGDERIVIRSKNGQELVNDEAGPIFLARLKPGHYIIEATHAGETQHRNVAIGKGKTATAHFGW